MRIAIYWILAAVIALAAIGYIALHILSQQPKVPPAAARESQVQMQQNDQATQNAWSDTGDSKKQAPSANPFPGANKPPSNP